MKKLLIIALICLAAFGAYKWIRAEMKTNLALNSKIAGVTDLIELARSSISDSLKGVTKRGGEIVKKIASGEDMRKGRESVEAVTIRLKHGGVISGRLIEKHGGSYVIDWKGERFEVASHQIAAVEEKTERDIEWPYTSDIVVVKTNGLVLDGRITDVASETVTMSFPQGGGDMEMAVNRTDIGHLLFAPVCNRESAEIEKRLKSLFPKMRIYKDGNITIFTDSYPTTAASYRKMVRGLYSQLYMKFFKLFKGRLPERQSFVVIFDDFQNYVEYAITDGVPGWIAVGYFSPIDKTLYSFNAFGERMEKIVFDVMVGKSGKSLDSIVNAVKARTDSRYHVFIDGQVKDISDRFWEMYNIYKSRLKDMTESTIRHEFAHEIFHNWGLQAIVLSKPNVDKDKMNAKKKEFLDTKDFKKKEELLMALMRLKKEEFEATEIEAARSWLAEGLATYCSTDPIGSIDEEWLYIYQEAARKGEVNPIEFLTNFRVGSFPGLVHKAALASYAQSWALTSFMMAKYPDQFIGYQIRFATEKPKDGEEDLQWLLKALGKDLPTLEREFAEYMKTYPQAEDPDVKEYMRYYKVWDDLMA